MTESLNDLKMRVLGEMGYEGTINEREYEFWTNYNGGGGGGITSIVAGDGIDVDDTDPSQPVVSMANRTSVIAIACSDEYTPITVGNKVATFRMPYDFTLSEVRATLTTGQAEGTKVTVGINRSGISILSTDITIDNEELSSFTAEVPPVIGSASLGNNQEISIDILAIGNGGATGLKVYLIGTVE